MRQDLDLGMSKHQEIPPHFRRVLSWCLSIIERGTREKNSISAYDRTLRRVWQNPRIFLKGFE
jgi:hypothetical protein